MTADEERNATLNVGGTRNAVALAADLEAGVLHHVSSVAVAGEYRGHFTEDMFDEGQPLPSPYHRTKFESERIVRTQAAGAVARVPAVARGRRLAHRRDGQDRRALLLLQGDPEGPRRAAASGSRSSGWRSAGRTSSRSTSWPPRSTTSRTSPASTARPSTSPTRARSASATCSTPSRAPPTRRSWRMRLDKRMTDMLPKGVLSLRAAAAGAQGRAPHRAGRPRHPRGGARAHEPDAPVRRARRRSARCAAPASRCRRSTSYAWRLWDHWERHLDPDLFKDRSFGAAVNGKTVLITGASSGIGRATALKIAAAGGIPLLVARTQEKLDEVRAEIERVGRDRLRLLRRPLGLRLDRRAACRSVFADHAAVDMLVNNAGRSIRRSVALSYDRFHDYERTIRLNYLGTDPPRARAAAAHARAPLRPHRQRLLDRRAGEPAALLRLRRLQGGARRVHARRDARRRSATT